VNQAGTTTTVVSSANPSVYSQSVTFTATVKAAAPGSGTPTGTVTFMDGTTTLGTATLGGGTASFSISTLSVGTHSIKVVYEGDTNFKTSTSAVLGQAVNQASTSTTLVSSANPSASGQSVTFTATVGALAPGSGTPTGTVTFYDGSTKLGTATVSGGAAGFTTSTLTVGTHSIKAVYSGDSNFKTSTSAVLSQVVNSAGAVVMATTTGSTSTATSSTTTAMGSTAVATGSSPTATSMAIAAAFAVDQAITALQDDPPAGSSVHDLALDQVSARARRGHR
jgi:hypothetical protein